MLWVELKISLSLSLFLPSVLPCRYFVCLFEFQTLLPLPVPLSQSLPLPPLFIWEVRNHLGISPLWHTKTLSDQVLAFSLRADSIHEDWAACLLQLFWRATSQLVDFLWLVAQILRAARSPCLLIPFIFMLNSHLLLGLQSFTQCFHGCPWSLSVDM